jgi:hypothetical protein
MRPAAAATIKHFDEILEKLQTTNTFEPVRVVCEKGNPGRLDMPGYCSAFGIEIMKTKDAPDGGIMYCLKHCVFDENHSPNEPSIIQQPTGMLIYQCFHHSCSGRTWHDARRAISGEQSLTAWLVGGNGHPHSAKTDAPIDEGEAAAIWAEGLNLSGVGNQVPDKIVHFEFIHNAKVLANLKPTEWRIQDVLTDYALYYNFGDPGSFKTFVEIDRLLHIARASTTMATR